MKIKLILSYDGTDFLGWQASKEGPTIEEALKVALEQIYQEPITLEAASRTDAGVHAEGQVATFSIAKSKDLARLKTSLNQLLPQAIRVREIAEVAETFHPTLDATSKEYHYQISLGIVHSPFLRYYSWHVHAPLDIALMQEAAPLFIGTHDFSSFCNANEPRPTDTIRTLTRFDLIQQGDLLRFEIEGNRFLYKMVRNLVGTLVYVGQGKLSLEQAASLLQAKDRTQGGVTAPAQGLILKKVAYPSPFDL